MTEKLRVGFIGLGYMGHGMAVNILRRGFQVTVIAHRKRDAVEDMVQRGATEVATPAEVAGHSDIVILCVTGSKEVDQLVRSEKGLATAARSGLVIVDCTTSNPSTLLALAEDYVARGIKFVDAPLGRSPREAWEGQLSTMVGGETEVLQKIYPVLSAFATTIQHVGALGNGHRLKLVNNFLSLGMAALYSESLVLALKAGFTTETYDELVRSSRMHSAFYDTFIGWALDGEADTHRFALRTALHAYSDVAEFAKSVNLRSRLSQGVLDIYRHASATGDGDAMLPELPRSIARDNDVILVPRMNRPTNGVSRSVTDSD